MAIRTAGDIVYTSGPPAREGVMLSTVTAQQCARQPDMWMLPGDMFSPPALSTLWSGRQATICPCWRGAVAFALPSRSSAMTSSRSADGLFAVPRSLSASTGACSTSHGRPLPVR